MQVAVEALVSNGALPSDEVASASEVAAIKVLLSQVRKPVTDDEAVALVGLFPPRDCFGLEWTLLHLIESAPGLACRRGPRRSARRMGRYSARAKSSWLTATGHELPLATVGLQA